jgi:hypothetical protein
VSPICRFRAERGKACPDTDSDPSSDESLTRGSVSSGDPTRD